jgi:hypothetical protein
VSISPDSKKELAGKTDQQLFDILRHDQDYTPEALEAALAVIRRRGLDPTQVQGLGTRAQALCAQQAENADKPLSWPARIIIFLLSGSLLAIAVVAVLADGYRSRGYTKKYSESWNWVFYGLGFWILLGGAAWLSRQL